MTQKTELNLNLILQFREIVVFFSNNYAIVFGRPSSVYGIPGRISHALYTFKKNHTNVAEPTAVVVICSLYTH